MSKRKKWTKRAKTTEQQADEDGWVYVYACKIIRGWNSVWVEGGRAEGGEVEGRAQRPYIPSPTGSLLQSSERYTDSERAPKLERLPRQ